jgi:hypothetical protein
MLSVSTLASLDSHAARFREAQPFRFAVIDDFLDASQALAMLEQFPGFDTRFALNEMGDVGGKAVRTRVRELGPVYRALDDHIQSPEFLAAVSRITGIPDLLYDPDYEGGGTHENRHGQDLDTHIDFNYHPRTGWHRRLNLIVYLNPEWESQWGGALELLRDPWQDGGEKIEVLPLLNRCVVFETNEVSWHGFQLIDLPEARRELSRKSFAIYLYTRERPPQETAAPHATVYVPPGMPADIVPGSVLDEASHLRLRAGFARLRGQLRFLYQRETEFTRQIQALEGAIGEMRAAQKIDLQGYAIQHGVEGCWPDGWCSSKIDLRFAPTRRASALHLDVWVPDRIDGVQVLSVQVDGATTEHRLKPGERRKLKLPLRGETGSQVEVGIVAARSWTPASAGGSGDLRSLAYRMIEATLEH